MLEFEHIRAGYRGQEILRDVSLTVPDGQVTVLIGPNGSGKTTLIRTGLGLLKLTGGRVLADGEDLTSLSRRELARRVALLSQENGEPRLTAGRLVLHGRFPWTGYPRSYTEEDRRMAREAMERTDTLPLSSRMVSELSGGERRRVFMAMVLAQNTRTVIMDEPTASLDIAHRLALLSQARQLAAEGKAVLLVLHELSDALRTADRIAVLRGGMLEAVDTPEELYASGLADRIFGIRLERVMGEDGWHYYAREREGGD